MFFTLIPAPLHRAGLRLAHALRKHWWRLAKPRVRGCRVVAVDDAGRVLLIRHSYGSGLWLLPGGGMKRGEAALATAQRELREETGCTLADPVEVALAEEALHGADNRVHVIVGQACGAHCADRREVIDAAFFALDALPAAMPEKLRSALPDWITAAKAARRRPAEVPVPPPGPTA